MKAIIVMLAALVSLSAFADLDKTTVTSLLKNKEVSKLIKKMDQDGMSLAVIEDSHALAGVTPRCPCSSYKLTFSSYGKGQVVKKVKIDGIPQVTTISE